MRTRRHILIRGTVQGVGFRPFVYNLALRHGVAGFVRNSGAGVEIEAEAADLDPFLSALRDETPALAHIAEIECARRDPIGETAFRILESDSPSEDFALVPPDIATCAGCFADFTSPANRRYLYPFTNCTNCGPRYTIIHDVPYDRPSTTMRGFSMCAACDAEYRNPADRRFHAQPNACPVCGPRLSDSLDAVREWLSRGLIVAIKGLGGYHLACDARNHAAVQLLRERKRRGNKPFALMTPTAAHAGALCRLDAPARALLESPLRPIVLLPRRDGAALSEAIAPGNRFLGVMLPYTPLHHLLFLNAPFDALVMTSGNLSEEPIVSREDELTRLDSIADRFLTHNRPIQTRVDDSVATLFRGRPLLLRRSRGYAPAPVDLGSPVRDLLAVGAEIKNTFCLTTGRYAILSQHIGDLENYETLEFFHETLAHMKRFFRVHPEAVAHDLHPGYLSTGAALQMTGLPPIPVQHHHAHIASCMAEHRLNGHVIGVAFDGTGYGADGAIWGGEILLCDYSSFERRYHLRYVPLAGGDAAVREPWRVALAHLRDSGVDPLSVPALERVPEKSLRAVDTMLSRRLHTVDTSSCGRLFDAVAALLGICLESRYEAQAAIELESAAAASSAAPFAFDLSDSEIDLRQTIRQIVDSLHAGVPVPELSSRFHHTLAAAIAAACRAVRTREKLQRVCLSGGSFQNTRLLEAAVNELEHDGFEVFCHSEIPPNDGGLSLGQAVIANARMQ